MNENELYVDILPGNEEYLTINARMDTFQNNLCGYNIDMAEAARSGFILLYVVLGAQFLRCVFCGLEIKADEVYNSCFEEHVTRNPNCAYLKKYTTVTYRNKNEPALAHKETPGKSRILNGYSCSEFDKWKSTEIYKSAIDNFEDNTVLSAMYYLRENNIPLTVDALYDAIFTGHEHPNQSNDNRVYSTDSTQTDDMNGLISTGHRQLSNGNGTGARPKTNSLVTKPCTKKSKTLEVQKQHRDNSHECIPSIRDDEQEWGREMEDLSLEPRRALCAEETAPSGSNLLPLPRNPNTPAIHIITPEEDASYEAEFSSRRAEDCTNTSSNPDSSQIPTNERLSPNHGNTNKVYAQDIRLDSGYESLSTSPPTLTIERDVPKSSLASDEKQKGNLALTKEQKHASKDDKIEESFKRNATKVKESKHTKALALKQPKNKNKNKNKDPLRQEYEKLFFQQRCNTCWKNCANTLNLPCRHLNACEECSETQEYCGKCGDEIIATVKVFFS